MSSRSFDAEVAMHHLSRQLIVTMLALLVSSCAGMGRSTERADRAHTNRDILTQEQLRDQTDLYQAIQSLRPTWLRPRGTDSIRNPSQVWVYLGGTRLGGVEHLRVIHAGEVAEVRFYNASAATQRWGIGHGAGAISVTIRSR